MSDDQSQEHWRPGQRYYADIFDAEGLAYVFDAQNLNQEHSGPFDSLDAARAEARRLNEERE